MTHPTDPTAPAAAPPQQFTGRRIFVIEGNEYPDELPGLSVDQVRQHFANWHTDLHNAEVSETRRGEDTVYTFRKRIGTKGLAAASTVGTNDEQAGEMSGADTSPRSRRDILLAALDAVPPKHLRIWPLARDLYRRGELDVDAANARADEFALAVAEINVVTAATRRVNGALDRWMDAA